METEFQRDVGKAARGGEAMDHAGEGPLPPVLAQDLRTDELPQIAPPSADATGAAIEDLTPAQRAAFVKLIKSQTGGAE